MRWMDKVLDERNVRPTLVVAEGTNRDRSLSTTTRGIAVRMTTMTERCSLDLVSSLHQQWGWSLTLVTATPQRSNVTKHSNFRQPDRC
jgi:hypothetical protein